jgi:Xaa-Pro aminopeptidase
MQTMHSTLLIGQYDWEKERLPKAEFEERMATLWKQVPPNVAGIAAYGDRRSNAELAYLTNFIPKLRDGLALIPRNGEAQLLVAGAGNMMPIAARQTWVEKLTPLSEPGKALAEWQAELKGPMVMLGGENLRLALRKGVDEALGGGDVSDKAGAALRAMMRAKRSREVAVIRRSSEVLRAMSQALEAAHKAGKSPTVAIVEAEHVAHKMGAQEARSLVSLDNGRTLRPFMAPSDKAINVVQAYLAVRVSGYWAEGYVNVSKSQNPAAAKAAGALKALIAAARPGAKGSDLAAGLAEAVKPFAEHPVVAGSAGSGIGLSLEEAPRLSAGSGDSLQDGDVVSLRAGVSGSAGHAIVSAMVAITAGGHEVIWSA